MKGYTATTMVNEEAQRIFEQATMMVAALPESEDLRCHELARAIGRVFQLTVVDGKYGSVEHSWCTFNRRPGAQGRRIILDVYCCGRLPMVQLVDTSWMLPHGACYKLGDQRTDVDEALVEKLRTELILARIERGTT